MKSITIKQLFVAVILSFASVSYGQTQGYNRIVQKDSPVELGTFQILLADDRMIEPKLSDTILELVRNERQQSQEIYILLDTYTKLYLPSIDQINDENFVTLELYSYE